MNAVILTAILSAGNSGMYSSTRMLFDMAKKVVRQMVLKTR
jgi:lysine-specific permease